MDGIFCHNVIESEEPTTYKNQPDYSPTEELKELGTHLLIYLDVWERHITYLEDEDEHGDNPSIREMALGGTDTASRAKVVWQIRAFPVAELDPAEFEELAQMPSSVDGILEQLESDTFPLPADSITEVNEEIVQLQQLEPTIKAIVDSLPEDAPDALTQALNAIVQSLQDMTELPDGSEEQARNLQEELKTLKEKLIKVVDAWLRLRLAPSQAKLCARARQDPEVSDDPCAIPPESRYRGLENQLYRVEVHRGGGAWDGEDNTKGNAATFKWSRENGSVVFPIVDLADGSVTLEHLGKDSRQDLQVGDWVEVVDDDYILRGESESLLQVTEIDPDSRQVTLSGTPAIDADQTPFKHPLLRRWDHIIDDPTEDAVPITEGEPWIPLERGIEIQFTAPGEDEPANDYRAGDYWLIPARTETGDVEWPGSYNQPDALPPHGVEHHYAPLAIISTSSNPIEIEVDRRRAFQPLAMPL